MVWSEWWPYDPVPVITRTDPYLVVKADAGKLYWWCACGRSKSQPWCDGSHKGTGFKPMMYVPERTGMKLLCGCKHGELRPLCNFRCLTMKWHLNPAKSAAMTFAASFAAGYAYTWLFHP